jgi:hypothetical protein
MTVPLRKDMPEGELSTADLAQRKRPSASGAEQTKPFLTDPYQQAELAESAVPDAADSGNDVPLFPNNEMADLRNRWKEVQTAFVDEPRRAVEQADSLVASAMKRLAEVFAEERSKLEKQWDRGDKVSTEDLRIALQRYRAFFQRLLSI